MVCGLACGRSSDRIEPGRPGTRIGNYLVIDVKNGGAIAGRATVSGDTATFIASLGSRYVTNGQEECCVNGRTKPQQKLVTHDGGLGNVVVWLTRCDSGKAPVFGATMLDQHECDFHPHVVALMAGDSIDLRNSDAIVHAVHGYRGIRTLFNIATPRQGGHYFAACRDTGVTRCICDAGHIWMEAYIHVLPNPYFAVTGPDGSYHIDGVPPGTYTVRFAHELWNSAEQTVTVPASGNTSCDIAFDVREAALPR